jgi:hypothetical protein
MVFTSIIRVIKLDIIRLAEHVACTGKRAGAYKVLVGKLEGKRPHARPRHKWDMDNNYYNS